MNSDKNILAEANILTYLNTSDEYKALKKSTAPYKWLPIEECVSLQDKLQLLSLMSA